MSASCPDGVAWFQVAGYNNGSPFQALTDSSVDSVRQLIYHHVLYSGSQNLPHPTANSAASGSPSWGSSFKLANVQTLLNGLCPASTAGSARFYVGQHNNAGGNTLASATANQWIAWTDMVGTTFSDLFDSLPGSNQFSGSGMRRSDGTTDGTYKHHSGHTTGCQVAQCSQSSGGANTQVIFEYTGSGGCDSNHGWTVWGNGNGAYYNSNRPGSTTRYGWMGVSGC